jgi:hypothetical protein
MPANLVFRFDHIAPNSGTSLFIHGYSNKQAVNYSAVVYPGSGAGVLFPLGRINLTQGETFRHVDGTVARKVYIQNLAPFNSCAVDILHTVENF